MSEYYGENTTAVLGPACEGLNSPEAASVSGGFCLANFVAAGWYRTSAVNMIAGLLLEMDALVGKVPVSTTSNSGGSIFTTRYFSLRDAPVDHKWSFPCYLLAADFAEVCFAHGYFGEMTAICEAETIAISTAAAYAVFGALMTLYGGPSGVASTYIGVYWPFLADLPIPNSHMNYITFWTSHAKLNTYMARESNWIVAVTVDDPGGSYIYGWESYYSRGLPALSIRGEPESKAWFSNQTVYQIAAYSANSLSGIPMLPISLVKPWNGMTSPGSVMLKLTVLALSLIQVNSMMAKQTVVVGSACGKYKKQCPIMDGGFTDNGPITPSVAFSSHLPGVFRPVETAVAGPSSTFQLVDYLFGKAPVGLYTLGGINLCPFAQVAICTMLTKIKEISVGMFTSEAAKEYYEIGAVYEFWKPEAQIFVPYCGDPLIFDEFKGSCLTDGVCHAFTTIIPGQTTRVEFTPDTYISQLLFVLESATPISGRFVSKYVPLTMLRMSYYHNMKDWFPDFAVIAPGKGGVGFTKYSGHTILDYLTYLVQRLTEKLVLSRLEATMIYFGKRPTCGYSIYKQIETYTITGSSLV